MCENDLWKAQTVQRNRGLVKQDFLRWLIFIAIGICTALVACLVDIVIDVFSGYKYGLLKRSVDANDVGDRLYIPYLYWVLLNVIPVLIGSVMVAYVEPIAGGSGIPQVKCYLNGIKIPRLIRIKTLLVKTIGVATSVIGGLAGGKEGPMIHSGAIIAAGLSQGKSTTLNVDLGIFKAFRNDHEKRDFVVGGAAAGVAAAFGAPIGGLLFSLEEGASFWNQILIWRTVVASIISSFTLNFVLSAYHKNTSLKFPGLFNLGVFETLPFEYFELLIFLLMGVAGGLLGALWNSLNIKMNIFRMRFVRTRPAKVLECVIWAALTATLGCLMMYAIVDCKPLGNDPIKHPIKFNCEDSEYNAVAALWFQTPESSVKSLFHDPPGSHKIMSLFIFVIVYFFLSCFTFGLSVSMGIFIPLLLVGAAWGRLIAMTVSTFIPSAVAFAQPGKYALIGAAAQLGGVVRMTISLSVILIESTGNISFALPLIVTLISAKWVGDYFNDGIYDTQIKMWRVPMLPWTLAPFYQTLFASNIMSSPVVCVSMTEKASTIYHILQKYPHNGFPVVTNDGSGHRHKYGCLVGLMLRHQLIIILKKRLFEENANEWRSDITLDTFLSEYPRYPSLNEIAFFVERDGDSTINMQTFMNPSPHSVGQKTSAPSIFQPFRALGLRHMMVVDAQNEVVGIITRKDFLTHDD